MRIGILGIKGVPGKHGVEVVVDSLLPHLAATGHEVTVYGYDSYARLSENYKGAKVLTVSGSSAKNLEMISHMLAASLDARKRAFDVVHIHNTDPCLLAWLPKARYGVVATSHGQAYVRKKWGFVARNMSKLAERFFIRIPDVITSVSKPLSDFYDKKYGREVIHIPNGVNLGDIPSPHWLEKWGVSTRRFLFCSAGRIEKTKGLDTLMKAYSLLQTDMPLVIAGGGSGSDSEYMHRLMAAAPENTKFVGFLTGDEFFSLYAHAGVFIFPSEYEAMSMALLEGLSFGAPTVFSDIPENTAVAEGLGYEFKVSDADSLTAVLRKVLNNYEASLGLGKRARREIAARHDWRVIAGQYNDIYSRLEQKSLSR